jgi:geranyl-CoA carboxylase alpha subunit
MYASTAVAKPFDSVLIANRGEIALRIIRTAKRLGYRTIAVFSDADEHSPHALAADVAVRIGPPDVSESYLNTDAILEAARLTGAQALIPGYGFLSENAGFAQAVMDAGLVWVGPPPAAIEAMGNKAAAKARMRTADVPCVPGFEADTVSVPAFAEAAEKIGYPILVKAAAGGGGRGMRRVNTPEELEGALESAQREAKNSFGDDRVLIERLVENGRHVELQVFGDTHGRVIHLGERDCSVQRRHQKVVEEAPCPVVDSDLRSRMGEAACAAARAVDYVGAGTVEFLLGPDGNFYFLEMNTRLQVEHPVTECITGYDLVEWQLHVASGGALPIEQSDLQLDGHAIEVRLYAEDPTRSGLPQPGPVFAYEPPSNIRVDDGLSAPGEIPANYDPMVAKLIAHGPDREAARRCLVRALDDLIFFGPKTNRDQLAAILQHKDFATGAVDTGWLEAHPDLDGNVAAPSELRAVAAALFLLEHPTQQGFRSNPRGPSRYVVDIDGEHVVCYADIGSDRITLRLGTEASEETCTITCADRGTRRRVRVDSLVWPTHVQLVEGKMHVRYRNTECIVRTAEFASDNQHGATDGRVRMPMTGTVLKVNASVGASVEAGEVLAVVEAMKLETTLTAPISGTVQTVQASVGESVSTDTVLFVIEPSSTSAENGEEN